MMMMTMIGCSIPCYEGKPTSGAKQYWCSSGDLHFNWLFALDNKWFKVVLEEQQQDWMNKQFFLCFHFTRKKMQFGFITAVVLNHK